jgi:hypothetical protein
MPNSPSTSQACGRIWTNTPGAWWLPAKLWNWVMAVFRGPHVNLKPDKFHGEWNYTIHPNE